MTRPDPWSDLDRFFDYRAHLKRSVVRRHGYDGLLSRAEIAAIEFAQVLAFERIEKDNVQDNEACAEICSRAGKVARHALDTMGLGPTAKKEEEGREHENQ